MNQILYQGKRQLNKKKIAFTVAIFVMIVFMIMIFISNGIKQNQLEIEAKIQAEEIDRIKQLEEERKNEDVKRNEERIKNRYLPLNMEELEQLEHIYSHSERKRVFLTFDDGPTEAVTPFILDLLKQNNIKANFFVLGTMVETYPSLVKREYDEGHYIANHSYSHKYNEIYQSIDNVIEEYNKTNQLIKDAVGNQFFNTLIFRFPGGSFGGYYADLKNEAKQRLKENGIASIDWNALTNDADGADTKEKIMENLYETTQDKSSIVLLMHDASDKILTYETLQDIINYFINNGYEFQTFFDAIGR